MTTSQRIAEIKEQARKDAEAALQLEQPKELTDEEQEQLTDAFNERTRPLWDDMDDHANYVMGYRACLRDHSYLRPSEKVSVSKEKPQKPTPEHE